MTRRLLAALLLLPLLASCGGGEAPALDPAEDTGLPRGEFVAQDLPGPFDEGDRLRLRLTGGQLSFSATCNTMSGSLTRVGDVLGVGRVGGTEIGCPGPGARQDRWLVRFFTAGPRYEPQDVGFTLTAFGDELQFLPAGDAPDDDSDEDPAGQAALEGTRWRLTGIEQRDGDAVGFRRVPRRTDAWLRIADDEVRFATGCNTGGGEVAVEGDRLRFRRVVISLVGCLGDGHSVEGPQVEVLMHRRAGWEVDGRQLRVSRGSTALVYDAD